MTRLFSYSLRVRDRNAPLHPRMPGAANAAGEVAGMTQGAVRTAQHAHIRGPFFNCVSLKCPLAGNGVAQNCAEKGRYVPRGSHA